MNLYRKTSHTTYDIKFHLVWITKYRKKVLKDDVAKFVRDILRQICEANDVKIIKGHVSIDHIHLFVSVPPHLSVSKLMQMLKGKSSYKVLGKFPEMRKQFWGRHFWARGYFCTSSGNITDEVITQYIENQDTQEKDNNFKIQVK